jgi:hypothetical protein
MNSAVSAKPSRRFCDGDFAAVMAFMAAAPGNVIGCREPSRAMAHAT